MFGYSWSGGDPVTLLQILLTNAGGLDVTHFNNASYTALMTQYVDSTSAATRHALVVKIQQDFMKYLPYLPLTYELGGTAVSKNYAGLEWDPWTSGLFIDNAYEK
jgi:ABC-type transport system substrate-binding protein